MVKGVEKVVRAKKIGGKGQNRRMMGAVKGSINQTQTRILIPLHSGTLPSGNHISRAPRQKAILAIS